MTRSEARWSLARLTERFGKDGVLIVPKGDPGADGADLVPGSALRWPPCECGGEKCPDSGPGAEPKPLSAAEVLSARLAERNRLSRQERL
ncbi:hypothetical protein [Streptomyces sp. NPDC088725]|uniref:hypothetical protein n=1 Tax=Streptomyces sp. NPDC088725 TaxID=3365873 RepID=UPI003805DBD3